MILGIGNDMASTTRISDLLQRFEERFLQKIYSKNELENYAKVVSEKQKVSYLAKRFAAKEAFAKALGIGIGRGVNFSDIEIKNDEFGKPFIEVINDKMSFVLQHFSCKKVAVHLSLTDENSVAGAFVIIGKVL